MSPDEYQRKRNMALSLLRENPALAQAIQETDEEGLALYGNAYILGLDHLVETLSGLLLDQDTYHEMRTLMIARPSLALNS